MVLGDWGDLLIRFFGSLIDLPRTLSDGMVRE